MSDARARLAVFSNFAPTIPAGSATRPRRRRRTGGTTLVNDNAYTNLMARANLAYAARSLREHAVEEPEAYAALATDLGLRPAELERWERAANAMHVPYDDRRGIHPQDASFLDRKVWDLEHTPPDQFPLLLHHHPLVIYRHQVIKQADVVLAMLVLGNEFSAVE
jgi:alpha,alpha-trehalose phosphorylase